MKQDKARKIISQLLFAANHSMQLAKDLLKQVTNAILTDADKEGIQFQANALQNEAGEALAKAKQLMWKHFQTEDASQFANDATLASDESLGLKGVAFAAPKEIYSKKQQEWFKLACAAVAEAFAVRIVIKPKGTECVIFGESEETNELANQMLEFVCQQMSVCFQVLKTIKPELHKTQYLHGFAHGVYLKVEQEQVKEQEQTPDRLALPVGETTALAVVGKMLARIDNALAHILDDVAKPATITGAQQPEKMNESYAQGFVDGARYKQVRIK